jgi:hypothetical protein
MVKNAKFNLGEEVGVNYCGSYISRLKIIGRRYIADQWEYIVLNPQNYGSYCNLAKDLSDYFNRVDWIIDSKYREQRKRVLFILESELTSTKHLKYEIGDWVWLTLSESWHGMISALKQDKAYLPRRFEIIGKSPNLKGYDYTIRLDHGAVLNNTYGGIRVISAKKYGLDAKYKDSYILNISQDAILETADFYKLYSWVLFHEDKDKDASFSKLLKVGKIINYKRDNNYEIFDLADRSRKTIRDYMISSLIKKKLKFKPDDTVLVFKGEFAYIRELLEEFNSDYTVSTSKLSPKFLIREEDISGLYQKPMCGSCDSEFGESWQKSKANDKILNVLEVEQ